MSIVLGLVRASLTRADGTFVNLSQATDFTSAFAETRDFSLSGSTVYTFIDTIIPKIRDRIGAVGLTLVILGRNRHEDPLQVLGTFPLDTDDKPVFTGRMESVVFHRARLIDQQLTRHWLLYGFEVWGEPDGSYL